MAASIWLAHLTCYDPALPGTRTIRLASQGYTSGAANYPPGGAAHTAYEPRIKQPALMRRDCFSQGRTGGASQVGYGAMELVNIDGGLDTLADVGLDGQPIEIILGTIAPDAGGVPTWTTVLKGTMEQPEIGWSKVSIILRDRQAELTAKPLSPNSYGGTNALPTGIDGVADMKGKSKPVCWGTVYNVSPPCVNTSKLVYQVNDGAVTDVPAVYDKAAALTKGADYATSALLLAAAPAAGTYVTCFAEGLFRLGSSPAGQVTADVVQGAAAGNRTAAQLIKSIATGAGGVASGDVSTADVTALDTATAAAEVGYWAECGAAQTCNAALDALANAVGAWWGFDRLGVLRMSRLEAPSGTPAVTLTVADILRIDRVASADEGRGVPAWKVRLGYKRYWTVQSSDLAGTVTDARRSDIAQAYRSVESSDAAVKTRHLLASTLEADTLLISAAVAAAEADRRRDLYKAERARYEARVAFDLAYTSLIDLGAVIQIAVNRFGMGGGKLLRVIGMRPDLRLRLLDLTLWG